MIPAFSASAESVRLAEVIASLSLATDLGTGQPLSFALRSCMLSLRLARAAGMDGRDLAAVYFQSLLRYVGCNVDTDVLAAVVGDELALRADFAAIDAASSAEVIELFLRAMHRANADASPLQLIGIMARGLTALPGIKAGFAGHCEVAQRLAARLGLEPEVQAGLGQLYERWDGKGAPRGLRGEQVAAAVRVVTLAQDALVHKRLGGPGAAAAMVRARSGNAYDPRLAECFCDNAASLMASLNAEPALETVLAAEPGEPRWLHGERFDEACRAMADFTDLKSRFTLGHSSGVAALAAEAARCCGLPPAEAAMLRRAGWVHDIGSSGVSSAIWEKPGALLRQDWDKVRMHGYYSERILSCGAGLSRLAELAGMHHERCDGSGYHRGRPRARLPIGARILAAADVYQALTEARPHRPALDASTAAARLRDAASDGGLDHDAVEHVLAAAGHRRRGRLARSDVLSERELQVLRLLTRGEPTKRIAQRLGIAVKTADCHIQHIYGKTGVSTRAGATLFAMEHGLLAPDAP